MLNQWLTTDTVQLINSIENWQSAIQQSGQPLLDKNIISPAYIDAIYQQHEKLGPYYVLAPGIAMPHARPEEGANALGLSLLVVKEGVEFNSEDNDPVYLIVMLAAPDSTSHIEMITQLAELFSTDEDIQKIIKADTVDQILDIINRY